MKKQYLKLVFTFIALLTLTLGYAQDTLVLMDATGECGTEPAGPVKNYSSVQLNNAKFSYNNTQYVFNVKTHFIDNIVPESEQELKALDLIGALNLYFNSANIYFKYQGYENIDNSNYLNLTGSNISDLIPNMSDNQIDVFIANTVNNTSAGVTWTWTWNSTGEIARKVIALRSDYLPTFNTTTPTLPDFSNYTAIHEVGHYLGLNHPHQHDFMRTFIVDESNGGFLTNQLNTVASLYQPFEAIYVGGETIISVTDNTAGDGLATVCRNSLKRHRFQKGFDYIFTQTYSPDSSSAQVHEIPLIENNTNLIS